MYNDNRGDLERRLRTKSGDFVLKQNAAGKSVVWQHFSLIFEKSADDSLTELQYYCSCNVCRRVYAYKAADGSSYGTKNLLEHARSCKPAGDKQMTMTQCLPKTEGISKADIALMKQKEAEYCVASYHSFRSVENVGLRNMLQTCVDFGAKYGKVDVKAFLSGRKAVSHEAESLALKTKNVLKNDRLKHQIEDSTVSLCIDLYTDDFRKKAYLDVHATWIDRDFIMEHAVLAVRHFGTEAHTGVNISSAVNAILREYNLSEDDTPVTTDHGSNIMAALRSNIRLDCLCHRLHTVLETAWRETKLADKEAADYETAVSDLCRYVKQATGIQEQLPVSLKHGGDTRPWTSMCRRAESVEKSYETLVSVLTTRGKLELVAKVNRELNAEILKITECVKEVFEALEKNNTPTLQLVVPSYYLLQLKLQPVQTESRISNLFRAKLRKYLDEKFWTSITALHWIACFLDPSFKSMQFIPQSTREDSKFKRELNVDLDGWLLDEMCRVEDTLTARTASCSDDKGLV